MIEAPHSKSSFDCRWTVVAACLSLVAVTGSLWLSLGMHLKACPLCLYQRSFAMSAAAVLLVGLLTELRRTAVLHLLALPLVVGGAGIAAFHEYLELAGVLECPSGLWGAGSAPQQSLAAFLALLVATLVPATRFSASGNRPRQVAVAVAFGLLMAVGTIKSAPPMPAAPKKPYDQPLDICRPPYRSP